MTDTPATVRDLRPAPYNPRKITAERLRLLGDSMGEFGDLSGIVFNRRTGRLIGGHQRVKHIPESAEITVERTFDEPTVAGTVREGYVDVAGERWMYREVDVDEQREVAMNIAANRHGGEFDFDSLSELLSDLDASGFDTMLTGFTPADLEGMLVRDDDVGGDTADLTPPDDPQSTRGEIYELGPHRLMCGDATSADDVSALLDGASVPLVVTSPPYWLGKDYEREKTWEEVLTFIGSVSAIMAESTDPHGRIVINTGTCPAAPFFGGKSHVRLLLDEWQRALQSHGWYMRYARIWAKRGQLALIGPDTDVIDTHWEFIAYFYRPDAKPFRGQRRVPDTSWPQDGLWEFHGEASAGGTHVAAFPVELPKRNIMLFSDIGDVVVDVFGGSGTTMIAAAECRRVCYMMEIDPHYCDVVRRRYATYVGDDSLMP